MKSPTPSRILKFTLFVLGSTVTFLGIPARAEIADTNPPIGFTLELQKIFDAGGFRGDQFGQSISIDGDRVAIGAPRANISGAARGAVYIFVRQNGSWVFNAKLLAAFGNDGDNFGGSVALSGDTLVVGAPNVNNQQGALYVFSLINGVWAQESVISPPPGSNCLCGFGTSLDVSNGTFVVGAPGENIDADLNRGAAFIYTLADGTLVQQAELVADQPEVNALFGETVAIDRDTIIVGSPFKEVGTNVQQGLAYIFTRTGTEWTLQSKLSADDGATRDFFAGSVDIDGDGVVIGAKDHDADGFFNKGSAYVFVRDGNSWSQQAELTAVDQAIGGEFGWRVAIAGDRALIGSPNERINGNDQQGAAYIFVRTGTSWSESNKLFASDGTSPDSFGSIVATNGSDIFVSAINDEIGFNNAQGSTYYFVMPVSAPDLIDASDSGVSNTDDITNDTSPTFQIRNTAPGATVELLRNGVTVASGIADSDSILLTDPLVPVEGTYSFQSRQTIDGKSSSVASAIVTIDTGIHVSVSQSLTQADPTRNQPIAFTLAFSETVFGVSASSISLAGSTANVSSATVTVTGTGPTYDVSVSNILSDGMIVPSVVANSLQDVAGNSNLVYTPTDNSVTLDTTPPTVTINQAATQQDPARQLPVNFSILFSEPVANFSGSAISLSGSTASVAGAIKTVTGSGNSFTVSISGISSNGGTVVASIPASVIQDLAGNQNLASTSTDNSVTLDNVGPTVTVNQASGQPDPANALPIIYDVVFSEPVSGLSASSISYAGSTVDVSSAKAAVIGSGTTYQIIVTGLGPNGGFLRVSLPAGTAHDAFGNNSVASTSSDNSVTYLHGIVDGGLELTGNTGTNQFWSSTSTRFGTSLCTLSACGNGNGTAGPKTGNGWIWFDGSDQTTAEQATASQTVNFPTGGVATLNYYLRIGAVNAPSTSILQVKIDGTVLQTIPEPAVADAGYNLRTVDVSAYADGKSHVLSFEYSRPAGATFDNFTIDDVSLSAPQIVTPKRSPVDFDGDGKTDISIFRPVGASGGAEWWYLRSSDGQAHASQFGTSTDQVVAADFTGDGKTDIAVWRPSTGQWFIVRSEDGSFYAFPFGAAGDIPMPADYDGDGKADAAVFRPSSSTWFILRSSDGQVSFTGFGAAGDQPVSADYDGDGKADIGVFRPNGASGGAEWWIQRTTLGTLALQFGASTDKAVPGDYTGDGKTDIAFFRPSDGQWFVLRSEDFSYFAFPFGTAGDVPVPGDYDGDGKWDAAVFRPSASTWFVNRSSGGTTIQQFATPTDVPVANAYVR